MISATQIWGIISNRKRAPPLIILRRYLLIVVGWIWYVRWEFLLGGAEWLSWRTKWVLKLVRGKALIVSLPVIVRVITPWDIAESILVIWKYLCWLLFKRQRHPHIYLFSPDYSQFLMCCAILRWGITIQLRKLIVLLLIATTKSTAGNIRHSVHATDNTLISTEAKTPFQIRQLMNMSLLSVRREGAFLLGFYRIYLILKLLLCIAMREKMIRRIVRSLF